MLRLEPGSERITGLEKQNVFDGGLKTGESVTTATGRGPGQQCVGQLDVLDGGLLGVPLGLHRVGRSQDGGASVQLADDSRLQSQKNEFKSGCLAGVRVMKHERMNASEKNSWCFADV